MRGAPASRKSWNGGMERPAWCTLFSWRHEYPRMPELSAHKLMVKTTPRRILDTLDHVV